MPYNNNYPKKSWSGRGGYRKSSDYPIIRKSDHPSVLLATEEQKSQMDIQGLTYDFAKRVIKLYQYLTEDSEFKEFIMSKQVLRSGTSIGANVSEGQHSQSQADFLSKMSISLKEANETHYWLRLLRDTGYITEAQASSIINDNERILHILIAIVNTTSQKMKSNANK